jgi:hypothetical protein
MATSLPQDPYSYLHPQSLSLHNIRYGPHLQQRVNVYRNAVRRVGGNPVLVYFHGGGWGSNEKTSTQEGLNQKQRIFWAYLLNSAIYGTDGVPFDLVSVEWRQHTWENFAPNNLAGGTPTPYEPTKDGAHPGIGPTSFPAYFPTWIDDSQRAIQWVKTNAERFGFDAERIATWGTSAGSGNAMAADLSPSRAYSQRWKASNRLDVFADSRVRAHLNWFGEIDFDPWYMHYSILAPAFGLVESVTANVRADMERLLLFPASDGTFPAGSAITPICRSISARHLAAEAREENRALGIRSYYWIGEDTTAPQPGYSTVPPYLATGHDYHQFADLAAACATGGIPHAGRVLDHADYSGSIQLMWESTALESYEWLLERLGLR